MKKSYLISALRNIRKHKGISFINLFGLTIGITCCLLILSYIINELSYDKFNTKAKNIYRITRSFYAVNGNETLHLSSIAPAFGPLLLNDFKEIKTMTRVLPNGTTALHYEDKLFNEKNAFFADEHFFDMFTVPVVKGDPRTALMEPFTMMVSTDMAKKYFGNADPINKLIKLDTVRHGFRVTGVFEPLPSNSHMHPDILLSFNTLKDTLIYGENRLRTSFGNNAFFTFVELPDNYNPADMESRFPGFIDRSIIMKKMTGLPANFKMHMATHLYLQKLTDIHLRSHLDDEIEENGSSTRVYLFSAIALFILLIACINYMNLSTARSTLRAKEIGIRKVIGAQRKEIILQFLSESVLITWMALLLAIMITIAVLPYMSQLSGRDLSMGILLHWQVLTALFILPFVIGIISGIYPALFMSAFRPVKVLKGIFKVGASNISFRKVLVVTQFTISIILIIATIIVYQQLHYIQQKSLGYNKDHLINMPYVNALNPRYEAFRADLLKNSSIKDATRTSRIPTGRLLDDMGASVMVAGSMQPTKIDVKFISADYDFVDTYGIQMAAGRNVSRNFGTDTAGFVINETAVSALGWKSAQDAVGKDFGYGNIKGHVIGVAKDFHFESLHQKIVPLLFLLPKPTQSPYSDLSVKIAGDNIPAAISALEKTWHQYLPETPFEYTFFDEKFEKLYSSEHQQGTIFTIFSCIAIFIACLGLFGLSAFTITQRVKEIGVRKVLGASIPQIVMELSTDFLKLVFIASVIALPIAWYLMSNWLTDFAFRINISWWVFVLAALAATIIAFATISYQSVKAAIANPVKSLRSE